MNRHFIARVATVIAVATSWHLAWAAGPSNAQYSIPKSAQNSGVGVMNSAQHQLWSSVGDGFGEFAIGSTSNTLSPGFWGSVLQLSIPLATISAAPASVRDNGTPIVFTVTLNPPPAVPMPVAIASATVTGGVMTGVTNTCGSSVLVGTSGTGTCSIAASNTVPADGPATATVTLASGSGWVLGSPNAASGTITDDDRAVGVFAPISVIEDGNNIVFNITCTGAPTATVSYSFSGTFVPLPPPVGPTIVTCGTPLVVTIPTAAGSVTNFQFLTLTLANPSPFVFIDGASSATVTVVDDLSRPIPTANAVWLALLGLLLAIGAVTIRKRMVSRT